MAATRCTHTGTQPTTTTTLWRESVCTWTWAEAGGEPTVTFSYQEPCVTFPRQVSATSLTLENPSARHCISSAAGFLLLILFCLSPALSLSQAVNHLSHMRWRVPPRGWNLGVVVTALSLWCRNLHLKRQESTAGRKVGIQKMWFWLFITCVISGFCPYGNFVLMAMISWLKNRKK